MAPVDAKIRIEVQPRYRDVLPEVWPRRPPPNPGELISSWLNRLAYDNGLPARDLGEVFGTGRNMWSARFELDRPSWLISELAAKTGQRKKTVAETFLAEEKRVWSSLLLPLHYRAPPDKATWLQFCPQCLSSDETPFFRKKWRFSTSIYCQDHKCYLLDRCPGCLTGIAAFTQTSLCPQHFCAICGFDLRTAHTKSIERRAGRTARLLDDMLRFEHATGRSHDSELVGRIRRLPRTIHWGQREFSTFSLAHRIKCLDVIAMDLPDVIGTDHNPQNQFWRRWIIEKGGVMAAASKLTAHIEQKLSQKKEESLPIHYDVGLYDLLTAYARRLAAIRQASSDEQPSML